AGLVQKAIHSRQEFAEGHDATCEAHDQRPAYSLTRTDSRELEPTLVWYHHPASLRSASAFSIPRRTSALSLLAWSRLWRRPRRRDRRYHGVAIVEPLCPIIVVAPDTTTDHKVTLVHDWTPDRDVILRFHVHLWRVGGAIGDDHRDFRVFQASHWL